MQLKISPDPIEGIRFNELDVGTWFLIEDNLNYLYVKIDSSHLLSVHDDDYADLAHIMLVSDYKEIGNRNVLIVKVNKIEVTRA